MTAGAIVSYVESRHDGKTSSPYSSMDEVVPGVWVGDCDARKHVEATNIRVVVSILSTAAQRQRLPLPAVVVEYPFVLNDLPDAPIVEVAREAVTVIETAVALRMPVLVHCAAGVSRSPSVVCAYLMQRDRCSFDDALALVRQRRACAAPNPGFRSALQAAFPLR